MKRLPHDLRNTLQRALNLTEGYARQQAVDVRQVCPPAAVMVDGDPEQLHQVFVNLVMNGIEAMPYGGVLEIAMHCLDAAGPICRLQFCDSGSGIPGPIMQRIFEPFVTDKERGTGLGLAISRRIVQQHGGKLTAANLPENGAVFAVELPLCAEQRNCAAGTQNNNPSKHPACRSQNVP
jgi:two-component system, NtrC family, sensor histidine kinase HydH